MVTVGKNDIFGDFYKIGITQISKYFDFGQLNTFNNWKNRCPKLDRTFGNSNWEKIKNHKNFSFENRCPNLEIIWKFEWKQKLKSTKKKNDFEN